MAKQWTAVKAEIEKEIDQIWFNEPMEVEASRKSLYPSKAGANGMGSGNMVYQIADTRAIGCTAARSALAAAVADAAFTLDACKKLFVALNAELANELGGKNDAPDAAAWLNMPKVWKFYNEIVEAFDSVQTKAEFGDLVWSWQNYVARLNLWFKMNFPWDVIGTRRPSQQVEHMEKLLKLAKEAEVVMKNAPMSRI